MKSNMTLASTIVSILFLAFGYTDIPQNKYGLTPISTIKQYQQSVQQNPNNKLVNLKTEVPTLVLDIRYATTNNFTKRVMYNQAKAFARKPVANSLKQAQAYFNQLGYSLKIFDGYRPYSVTVKFYETYSDTTYVASPYKGSRHNRGAAIDLTLVNLKTGKQLNMGTPYDDFTKKAHPTYTKLPKEVLTNRKLLIDGMKKFGFTVYASEWWHFDYQGWQQFELMDLSFDQLTGK